MTHQSDAAVMAPGFLGTFEEAFQWCVGNQLGYHSKPFGIFSVKQCYRPFNDMLGGFVREGFAKASDLDRFKVFHELKYQRNSKGAFVPTIARGSCEQFLDNLEAVQQRLVAERGLN